MWSIPEEFRTRATEAIDFLLHNEKIVFDKPLLAHGDLKLEHLLVSASGELQLLDFEHSRYAVGPLDIALWLCAAAVWGHPDCNAQDVCTRVKKLFDHPVDRYLCVCWIVAEVIFVALLRFSSGGRQSMATAHRLLRDLALILLNIGIIP
jgi:hypothetical protein